ncbi:MAG: hypothetical protein O7D93_04990 [Acidobacteria bacterium]|nr:hypothetical protein [Acidobacteriota bacterium]MCZ6877719.1 hypothetical protein [Acidobacteriota bacterium]
MELIDIHSHLLPRVDDGSVSVDETIAMLKIAHETGTRKIVLTPHMFLDLFHNNDFVEIGDRIEQLKLELESCQDAFPFLEEMHLYSGAENYASPEFLKALDQGCVLTLNGSRYLLLEFYMPLPFSQIQEVIERVSSSGYTPVIAHPERYGAIQEDPARIEQFWEMGCVVQVNADSFMGGSGSRAKKCVRRLLTAGVVDVIASDGHRLRWRPPNLGRVLTKLEQEYERESVVGWLLDNPGLILANERLIPAASALASVGS